MALDPADLRVVVSVYALTAENETNSDRPRLSCADGVSQISCARVLMVLVRSRVHVC